MGTADFLLNGDRLVLTDDEVRDAVRGVMPGPIQTWSVIVNGTAYPVKQVLRAAIRRSDFTSQRAADILRRLGFEVSGSGETSQTLESAGGAEGRTGDSSLDATRLAALNAAIEYADSRSDLDLRGVLDAAGVFDAWLRTGTARV